MKNLTSTKSGNSENRPSMDTSGFPKDINELLTQKYGPEGTLERADFQASSKAFKVGQIIRQKRLESNMTQQALADRIGTHKSYISKIENGADMNVSTMLKIFDFGLQSPVKLVFGEVLL